MEKPQSVPTIFIDSKAAKEFQAAVERNVTSSLELAYFFADDYFSGMEGTDLTLLYQRMGIYGPRLNPGDVPNDRELFATLIAPVIAVARNTSVSPQNRTNILNGPIRWLMSDLHLLYASGHLSATDKTTLLEQACAHLDQCIGWAASSIAEPGDYVSRKRRKKKRDRR